MTLPALKWSKVPWSDGQNESACADLSDYFLTAQPHFGINYP